MNCNTSNIVFLNAPQVVDSANVRPAMVTEKFTDCPRGRPVNGKVKGVNGECERFTVPSVPLKTLRADYPHEWNSFRAMKYRRCGKNGKYVCHPDIDTFPKFLAAFGPCPDPSYTLDRIDPTDLEYAPGKCEWASKQRQGENKTNIKFLTTSDGTCLHVSEWSRRSGIPRKTILRRVNELGWSHDDAVGIKVGGRRSNTTDNSPAAKRSLFPDAAPAHLQSMLHAFTQGLDKHHDCPIFLLEWKNVAQLEYIHEGLLRCGVSPTQVVTMVVERWRRFAPYKDAPTLPCLAYLKHHVMDAAHYYLCNGGTRLLDECPDQIIEPTTPLDFERDL